MYPTYELHRNLHISVYIGIIHNHQEAGDNPTSFSGWMVQQMTVWPYHEILLSNKKDQTTDAHSLDGSQMCHAEWDELDSQGCMSPFMTFWKKQNHREENPSVGAWLGVGEGWVQKGTRGSWGLTDVFYALIAVVVTQLCVCQNSYNCTLKNGWCLLCVNYTSREKKNKWASTLCANTLKSPRNTVK